MIGAGLSLFLCRKHSKMIGGENVRVVGQNRLGERREVCLSASWQEATRVGMGRGDELGPHFHARNVGGQAGMGL